MQNTAQGLPRIFQGARARGAKVLLSGRNSQESARYSIHYVE